jgi:hypothetical protein
VAGLKHWYDGKLVADLTLWTHLTHLIVADSSAPPPAAAAATTGDGQKQAPATMEPEAAAPGDVAADVAALLSQLSLSSYGCALRDTLGMTCVADAALLTEKDLEKLGMKPVEARKLLKAVAAPAPAAPVAASGGAAASSAVRASLCDVMISYRVPETGDGGDNSVFIIQKALEARGFRVFVGEAAIQGGSSWATTIQKGVEDCKAFVILCSPTYGDPVDSPWTKRELELADGLKKPLIPVWHSGVFPPHAVSISLQGTQRIPGGNFRNGYVAAKVTHAQVAEEVVAALAHAGVSPTGPKRK